MSHGSKDLLHDITLKAMLTQLEAHYGWEQLGLRIKINCFTHEPSISSSLKFLRRTPWARKKVEALYLKTFKSENTIWQQARKKKNRQQ